MKKNRSYIPSIFSAITSLTTGLRVTVREFFTPKITECYPENRDTLEIAKLFRGVLKMPHDADGNNKCIACGLCQNACPNGTLVVKSEVVTDEETGRKSKRLIDYRYNLGSCMYCNLCVDVCPTNAIHFTSDFEHSVFDKSVLDLKLNKDQKVNK